MDPVVYHSLDFDGCFSNECSALKLGEDWSTSKDRYAVDEAYLEANAPLLKSFKKGTEKTVLLLGSNRQTPHLDFKNAGSSSYPTGSAYPRMKAVANELDIHFTPFLLPDLEPDNPEIGVTYEQVMKKYLADDDIYKTVTDPKKFTSDGFTELKDDESKVSLVYAQMQLAATYDPAKQIEFNFYEDRKDILEGLNNFFGIHPQLIPKNITLNLIGYSGPSLTQEEAQENLERFIVHRTEDINSDATKKIKKEAEKNNFPVFIKVNGAVKLYRRDKSGTWDFVDIGEDDRETSEKITALLSSSSESIYIDPLKHPKVFTFLKSQHFLPIPKSRKGSIGKAAYDYGDPKIIATIIGTAPPPTSIEDWKPVYNAMREVSVDDELLNVAKNFTVTKLITYLFSSRKDRPPPEKIRLFIEQKFAKMSQEEIETTLSKSNISGEAVHKVLQWGKVDPQLIDSMIKNESAPLVNRIGVYKYKINQDLFKFSKQLVNEKNSVIQKAGVNLFTTIDVSENAKLTLKDCETLEKIVHHAHIVLTPDSPEQMKFDSLSQLGILSDEVSGRKSKVLGGVAVACGIFAVVSALVLIALSLTGIGLAIGIAVFGALTVASIGSGIASIRTETDLSKKTREFKNAVEHLKEEPPLKDIEKTFPG